MDVLFERFGFPRKGLDPMRRLKTWFGRHPLRTHLMNEGPAPTNSYSALSDVLAMTTDCVLSFHENGELCYVNGTARSYLQPDGYREIPERLNECFSSDESSRILDEGVEAVKKGSSWTANLKLRTPERDVPLQGILIRHESAQGDSIYTLVGRDMTDRYEKERIEVANREKSRFLADMSHEIRSPLSVIIGFSEVMVSQDQKGIASDKSAELIHRNAVHLKELLDDILDLSKAEAGGRACERVRIQLDEILNCVLGTYEPLAKERGLTLKIEKEGFVPAELTTDAVKFRQILMNLVSNAIKFTENGWIRIRLRLIRDTSPETLELLVEDTGRGLTSQQQCRLFQPFSQADQQTKRKYGGTGLGLVLSRQLARTLGGDVTLHHSTPGKGSVFRVTLNQEPYGTQALMPDKETLIRGASSQRPTKGLAGQLTGCRILLVEDGIDNQILLKHFLAEAGARVDIVETGREAIATAKKRDYSVILMDIRLPDLNGYESTQKLRQDGYQRPILALTAHALRREVEKSLASGCDGHIAKPVDSHTLIGNVRSALDEDSRST